MKIVSDHGFPKAATEDSPFEEAFAAFKNERDYIAQSGRMKTTVAAMDWASREIERLRAVQSAPSEGWQPTDAQIKHMVDRFLGW